MASAGPYESLYLAPDNHASTPPLSFYRPDALPAAQPTASKHWRLITCHVSWQNLVLLLVMNIVIDFTCQISGIYTNFCGLLCKKCNVGYCVINWWYNEIDDYQLAFIVSISLLRKIPNACQHSVRGIVAYTFLNVCEKSHQFLSVTKKDGFLYFCLTVYMRACPSMQRHWACSWLPVVATVASLYCCI